MKNIVASAGFLQSLSNKDYWLYPSFEYGLFPLVPYIVWSFDNTCSYKFWLNGKLVARKALEF